MEMHVKPTLLPYYFLFERLITAVEGHKIFGECRPCCDNLRPEDALNWGFRRLQRVIVRYSPVRTLAINTGVGHLSRPQGATGSLLIV